MRTVVVWLLFTATSITLPAAASQVEPPLVAREEVDIPLTLGCGALWLITELGIKDSFTAPAFDESRYEHIGDMDRRAIGNWNPSTARASDAVMIASFVTPFVFNTLDLAIWGADRANHGLWLWSDALIIMEAIAVTGALTNMAKWAFTRYRPYAYIGIHDTARYDEIQADPDLRDSLQEAVEEQDAALSFWSGHTSLTFAALCASATLLTAKHMNDHPAPLFALWGGTFAAGAVVAILRVESGKHFPSDVIVGALVGSAIGIVVPALHRNRDLPPVAIAPLTLREGGGLAVTAVW